MKIILLFTILLVSCSTSPDSKHNENSALYKACKDNIMGNNKLSKQKKLHRVNTYCNCIIEEANTNKLTPIQAELFSEIWSLKEDTSAADRIRFYWKQSERDPQHISSKLLASMELTCLLRR